MGWNVGAYSVGDLTLADLGFGLGEALGKVSLLRVSLKTGVQPR